MESNTISVILDSNNPFVATINMSSSPSPNSLTYDPGTGNILAANADSGTLSAISDNANTVVATVPAGENPQGVAYDSAKDERYS